MKVAIYVRVSTAEQDNDNQLIRLDEFARNRGYEVFRVYEDKISGRDANRPGLDQLRKDAKARRFDHIVATKIDRLARSTIDLLSFLQDMELYGVSLEILDQPIETRTASGRMVVTIIGAVAEFERELIRDRTRDGLERARKKGTKLGRREKTLSDYQRDKIKMILAENPDISNRALAAHFEGISRTRLIELARAEGLIA